MSRLSWDVQMLTVTENMAQFSQNKSPKICFSKHVCANICQRVTQTLCWCKKWAKTVLNLKSIRSPGGWDFMDVWLFSAVLPWGALWIRWMWRPVNPLIELSLPEEETMKGVSSWLQKYGHRSRISRPQLILTQSRRRLIPPSSRRTGTGAIQSQLSLESFHLFSLHDRGGHISTWLPLNSPDTEVCSFLWRLSKSSSLMTPQGVSSSTS